MSEFDFDGVNTEGLPGITSDETSSPTLPSKIDNYEYGSDERGNAGCLSNPTLDEDHGLKLALFLNELSNIKLGSNLILPNRIIDNFLLIEDESTDFYPKCFKDVYWKVGGAGFHKGYDKKC